jgi:nucleoside-diphosphate-sugar epimerase
VIIIGCGYIGRLLGRKLAADGAAVTGVVRSAESAALLPPLGIEPLRLDLLQTRPRGSPPPGPMSSIWRRRPARGGMTR